MCSGVVGRSSSRDLLEVLLRSSKPFVDWIPKWMESWRTGIGAECDSGSVLEEEEEAVGSANQSAVGEYSSGSK